MGGPAPAVTEPEGLPTSPHPHLTPAPAALTPEAPSSTRCKEQPRGQGLSLGSGFENMGEGEGKRPSTQAPPHVNLAGPGDPSRQAPQPLSSLHPRVQGPRARVPHPGGGQPRSFWNEYGAGAALPPQPARAVGTPPEPRGTPACAATGRSRPQRRTGRGQSRGSAGPGLGCLPLCLPRGCPALGEPSSQGGPGPAESTARSWEGIPSPPGAPSPAWRGDPSRPGAWPPQPRGREIMQILLLH